MEGAESREKQCEFILQAAKHCGRFLVSKRGDEVTDIPECHINGIKVCSSCAWPLSRGRMHWGFHRVFHLSVVYSHCSAVFHYMHVPQFSFSHLMTFGLVSVFGHCE